MSVFHARKTYKALSAGYGLRDLRTALAAWQAERREELAFETSVEEPKWARLMRQATYVLSISSAVVFRRILHARGVREAILIGAMGFSAVLLFTASNALGVRLISPRIKSKLIGFARSAIWNSRVGEWAAKLLTPKQRTGAAQLDYRPTEMALGLAVGDLYAALPKAYREHLSDLPNVVERLEAHAAAARARVEELSALVSLGGSTPANNLVVARDAAKTELAESVAALEAVRLDLLRLHGGAVDLRPLTTVLEAARELGEELDRLNRANREVSDIVRPLPLELEAHTPV
jgi:serine/threonine-protein kinase